MNEKATVKELIEQARNTQHLVYEVASAYLGVPPEKLVIAEREEHRKTESHNFT